MRLNTFFRIGACIAGISAGLWGCSSGGSDVPAPISDAADDQEARAAEALANVNRAFPTARVQTGDGRVRKIFGSALTSGATPHDSVRRFIEDHARNLGADPSELFAAELSKNGVAPSAAPKPLGLMLDRKTGKYKYFLYRYGHARNGIEVFNSGLLVLVRNGGQNPTVWASSNLKSLGSFAPSVPLVQPAVDRDKSLAAVQRSANFTGRPLLAPAVLDRVGTPEVILFAGVDATSTRPTLAIDYIVESDSPPGKWRLVADASTGDVLHVEDRIVFENVVGSVAGNVTAGAKAMECAEEAPAPFPYAQVNLTGGGFAFTDATGAFVLDNAGTTAVNLASAIGGNFFDVTNMAGTSELLTQSVVPPGPASFLHNAANTAEHVRAQVNGYVHANQVRDFLLTYVPEYPVIATQLNFPVNVNRSDVLCPGNAWYDFSSINFCVSSTSHGNTSFASVNHHEYGHHIVTSGGSGQGAYGEGMSDTVAMLYSGDPGLGYGFFLNSCATPLRTADNTCQYSATSCSSCGSASHSCGNLISGTIYDVRQALQASEPETFADTINALVLSAIPMHTGTTIDASIAVDLLTLDDDDDNLDNGTPHYQEICSGFEQHGMSCPPILTGLAVNPDGGLDAEGPSGGPFAPESVAYTLVNNGPAPVLDYLVAPAGGVSWITVTNGSGQIALGEQAQVIVGIDQAVAAGLANGAHSATVEFKNLTDGVGDTIRTAQLEVGVPTPIFTEDFEGGLGAFVSDGGTGNLWHASGSCASLQAGHTTPGTLYFGLSSTCNFQTSPATRVLGTITSPPIVVQDTSVVKLRFNYFLETESSSTYDKATVSVSVNDGAFSIVASNGSQGGSPLVDPTTATVWQAAEVDISSLFGGQPSASVRLRFGFDSVDSAINSHDGFLVDDVQLRAFAGTCTLDVECDDGAYCTGVETCQGGTCAAGTPVACSDGVSCTTDSCDEATDSCQSQPNNGLCSDGSLCNGVETCNPVSGCQPGTPLDCNDGNACTTDGCNPASGCTHGAVTCNDGNACTTDSCNPATGCQTAPLACNDGNACTTDSCDPATGCQTAPLTCNDGNACTTDSCNPATGCLTAPVTCSDGNECTTDGCNPASGCQFTPSTGACTDDGNSCTNDVCSAGQCTHPDSGTCGNGPFQESGGQVVMEAEHFHSNVPRAGDSWSLTSNTSASGGQVLSVGPDNGTSFNTGYTTGSPQLGFQVNFVTTGTYNVWVRGIGPNADGDSCHAGIDGTGPGSADRMSTFGTSLTWSRSTMDGNVATIVVTTPGIHTINIWMREDGFVFDKLILTTNGSFSPSGAGPAESPRQGSGGCTNAAQCNDGNPCTQDACVSNACQNTAVANGTSCPDDGNVCTNDVCGAGTCTHPNNTASCADDGNSCTNDVCNGGVCTHPNNGSCQGQQPCSAYCSNPVIFSGPNFQSNNLGTAATCHQTTANLAGGVCGNFANGRQLRVNGQSMSCTGNWPSPLPAKVNGGYCVYTTAGDHPWAYFSTW